MVAANPVTSAERQFARLMARDQERIVRLATVQAGRRLQIAFSKAIRAYRQGLSVDVVVYQEILALADMFGVAMTVAHLQGVIRTQEHAPLRFSLDSARAFLRKRMGLTTAQTKELTKRYTAAATTVVPRLAESAARQLQSTMLVITAKNLHVRDGVKLLKKDFVRFGLSPGNPYAVEAVFRTQTALAYSAGQWKQEQAPEIQEILWGYKYVTVGDDRVRDSHVGFDGVTLPKDDDFWDTNTPPNGWACRCQVLTVFDEGKKAQPKTIDGVKPKPDKGFDFHPGKVLEQRGKSAIVPKLPKPKKPVSIPKKATTLPEPVAKPEKLDLLQARKLDFIDSFGVESVKVEGMTSIKGAEALQTIHEVARDLRSRVPGIMDNVKAIKIAPMKQKGDLAEWIAAKGEIQFDPLGLFRQTKVRGTVKPIFGEFSVDKSTSGIIRHEFGHASAEKDIFRWRRLHVSKPQSFWESSIGEYAATSPHELAAESFSAWTHPGYAASAKKLPKAIEDLLERTVGRPKGFVAKKPVRISKKVKVPKPETKPVSIAKSELLETDPVAYIERSWDTKVKLSKYLVERNPRAGKKVTRVVAETLDDVAKRHPGVRPYLSGESMRSIDLEQMPWRLGGRGEYVPKTGKVKILADMPLGEGRLSLGKNKVTTVTFQNTFRHELGHVIAEQGPLGRDFKRLFREGYWGVNVSRYAATNWHEFAAECISAWTHPGYAASAKKLPKAVEELLRKHLGG